MSYFFGRTMILLLVVDLNRSFASFYYDNVTDTEYEVISLEKKKYRLISIIDVAPYQVWAVTKFEQFVSVLCYHWTTYKDNSIAIWHIRIYEDIHPFNLLFVINIGRIRDVYDWVWNEKTRSLFVYSDLTGVWEIKWEDHYLRKLSCPTKRRPTPGIVSLSNDGHVLIIGRESNLLYVCNTNGTLIRQISFAQFYEYTIRTTLGEYSFDYYDRRLSDRKGSIEVDLSLSEMNDFNVESNLDVNRTNECNATSTNMARFSFFIIHPTPEKYEALDLFNVTIERRSKINEHFPVEYSASDERLLNVFLSNKGDRFWYNFNCNDDSNETWCFNPLASDGPLAKSWREYNEEGPDEQVLSNWLIEYHYDRDKNQLIVGFSNVYSDDQDGQRICILTLP